MYVEKVTPYAVHEIVLEIYTAHETVLFFNLGLETTPFIPKGYVAKEEGRASGRSRLVRSNKRNSSPSIVHCVQVSRAGVPPYKIEMKRKEREE